MCRPQAKWVVEKVLWGEAFAWPAVPAKASDELPKAGRSPSETAFMAALLDERRNAEPALAFLQAHARHAHAHVLLGGSVGWFGWVVPFGGSVGCLHLWRVSPELLAAPHTTISCLERSTRPARRAIRRV